MAARLDSDLQLGWTGSSVVAWWWDGVAPLGTHSTVNVSRLYLSVSRSLGHMPVGAQNTRVKLWAPSGPVVIPAVALPATALASRVAEPRNHHSSGRHASGQHATGTYGEGSDSWRWLNAASALSWTALSTGHVRARLDKRPAALGSSLEHPSHRDVAALLGNSPKRCRPCAGRWRRCPDGIKCLRRSTMPKSRAPSWTG
ncbi:MAG: hypothetical protein R2715_05555 [Ilumatobacteraceae bacterium]